MRRNIYQQFLLFITQTASSYQILVIVWLNLPHPTCGQADNINIIFLILKEKMLELNLPWTMRSGTYLEVSLCGYSVKA